jgi:hypothetical protein
MNCLIFLMTSASLPGIAEVPETRSSLQGFPGWRPEIFKISDIGDLPDFSGSAARLRLNAIVPKSEMQWFHFGNFMNIQSPRPASS